MFPFILWLPGVLHSAHFLKRFGLTAVPGLRGCGVRTLAGPHPTSAASLLGMGLVLPPPPVPWHTGLLGREGRLWVTFGVEGASGRPPGWPGPSWELELGLTASGHSTEV